MLNAIIGNRDARIDGDILEKGRECPATGNSSRESPAWISVVSWGKPPTPTHTAVWLLTAGTVAVLVGKSPSTELMGALNSSRRTRQSWHLDGGPRTAPAARFPPGADCLPAERIVPGKAVVRQNHDGVRDSRAILWRTQAVMAFALDFPRS
jgi:hypothetical protein